MRIEGEGVGEGEGVSEGAAMLVLEHTQLQGRVELALAMGGSG